MENVTKQRKGRDGEEGVPYAVAVQEDKPEYSLEGDGCGGCCEELTAETIKAIPALAFFVLMLFLIGWAFSDFRQIFN